MTFSVGFASRSHVQGTDLRRRTNIEQVVKVRQWYGSFFSFRILYREETSTAEVTRTIFCRFGKRPNAMRL